MLGYAWRDLVRNPRRTLAAVAGVALGVGLFSGVLFYSDGSGATLTKRAIAPLALDMQRVLTSPLGRRLTLREEVSPTTALSEGQQVAFTLTVVNDSREPANEVVVNDEPPPPLSYVQGTTTLDGEPLADQAGQSPLAQGLARSGLNIGRVPPGGRVTLGYRARANQAVADASALPLRGRISSREDVVPQPANAAPPMNQDELLTAIKGIPGVTAADGLSFVDLPPAALQSGGSTVAGPTRVFAFGPTYLAHYPSIRVAAGSFAPGSVLLSAEAARALGVEPGATVALRLPGRDDPVPLQVGGVADLARATPLFSSRKSTKLEDFLYVPSAVVVDPETFQRTVVPAFQAATATTGSVLKALPVSEVDVLVDRARLPADPARALAQTKAIAEKINQVAPDQDYLIDNISNSLAVARDDAVTGKEMFVFLGLPAVLLAAFLAAYAGRILASTQRREHANLRIRGAGGRHLRRLLAYRALALAAAGSVLGVALGFASVLAILGGDALLSADPADLVVSGLVAAGVGLLVTALALYVPGRRALRREINEERRELALDSPPAWRRRGLDLVLVAMAAVAGFVALWAGAFDRPLASVSAGRAASLPSYLLLAPLVAWLGGTLVSVRAAQGVTSRLPVPGPEQFGPVVRGTLSRSLRRRSWALGTGMVGLGLIVAFGVNLAVFASTYDAAKAADARFVVGSDLRVTPSVLAAQPPPEGFEADLDVDGVAAVTPVVAQLENAVLIGPFDQFREDLAAIDPGSFRRVAALSDSFFVDGTAADAMAALESDPHGLLVGTRAADDLSIEVGDEVDVLLARGTESQVRQQLHVVGLFDQLPGFPQGLDLVTNLSTYETATGLHQPDFYLARVEDRGSAAMARAVAALETGPGQRNPIHVDTSRTALDKDQSSLAALDIHGLVLLDLAFTLVMSAACMAIFVFGLLLQRRRELVTLRAQGMPARQLRALVLGEAGLVAGCGLAAGVAVGVAMAYLFVRVLRPLFVIDPTITVEPGLLALVLLLPAVATVASAFAATAALHRMRPTELLRET